MKAFPLTFTNERGHSCGNYGMDLRDYFAAKALAVVNMNNFTTLGRESAATYRAREAYAIANAMMEARDASK